MYKRQLPTDEMLSLVLLFFALMLVFAFFLTWKLVGVDTFDAEMITYIVLDGLMFLAFMTTLILYFIGRKRPFNDLIIDFKERSIRLFYGMKKVSFDDIKLFSFNKRHKQVRLFLKGYVLGFSIDHMMDKKDNPMNEEVAMGLRENTIQVAPEILYNYHLFASSILFGFYVVYCVVYGRDGIPMFGSTYLPTYWVLLGTTTLIGASYGINRYRLTRYFRTTVNNEDTSEN